MKRIICLCLVVMIFCSGCSFSNISNDESTSVIVNTDFFVPYDSDLATANNISKELKALATQMPSASYDALPNWHGTHIANKYEQGWTSHPSIKMEYEEYIIEQVADMGFNFIRVPVDTRIFFSRDNTKTTGDKFNGNFDNINLKEFENLDQLISWCIERKIHVCIDVHNTPGGYMLGGDEEAARKMLFTQGSKEEEYLVRFWDVMSKRYADVSTNALSFNLYNEPPTFAADAEYSRLMKLAINAIRENSPDRLMFVDMLDYSTIPVYGLVDEKVAQSFHNYYPSEFTHANTDFMNMTETVENPAIISYPVPMINSALGLKDMPYTVNGDFNTGTQLRMICGGGNINGTVQIVADGTVAFEQYIDKEFVQNNGLIVYNEGTGYDSFSCFEQGIPDNPIVLEYTLENPCSKLEILFVSSNNGWFDLNELVLETPKFTTSLMATWIDGIMDDLPNTVVSVSNTGVVASQNSLIDYQIDIEKMRERMQTYSDFSKETGVAVMLQEFGEQCISNIECSVKYYDDILTVCDELDISWCQYGLDSGTFSFVAVDDKYKRLFGTYTKLSEDRYVCNELLTVFQKHMKIDH